jgi:hypothetical protein
MTEPKPNTKLDKRARTRPAAVMVERARQVVEVLDDLEIPDLVNKFKAMEVLTAPNSEPFVAWFDKYFIRMNRFPTGTSVDLCYAYYVREEGKMSPERFERMLRAAFEVFEYLDWAITTNSNTKKPEVRVAKVPVFKLQWLVESYSNLTKRFIKTKIAEFFRSIFRLVE